MTRPLRTRRLLAALAVAPLLSTALVACGGDDTAADDGAAASSATSEAAADEAAATDDLEEGQQVSAEQFVDLVAAGVEESTTATVRTTSAFGSTTFTGDGRVDYTQDPPALTMRTELPGAGGSAEVVSVDGIVYVSLGELSQGKFWKIDPSDPEGPFASLGMDGVLRQGDPLAALRAMEKGIEEVTYVGEEDVEGRDLDHFELTVDLVTATESLGGKLPESALEDLPKTLTYDVWLDEVGRFGKMLMEMPVMGQTTRTEMVVDDWGTDVTIEAPPAGEVTEVPDPSQLMGQVAPSPTA